MRLPLALILAFGLTSSAFASDDDDHHRDGDRDGRPTPHIIHVLAGPDAARNGYRLLEAVSGIAQASATQPYVIQLDAGTFSIAQPVTLLPYISLRGAGMTSTILKPLSANFITTLFFQNQLDPHYVAAPSDESLSDLTIWGIQPFSATVNGFLVVDHVQLFATGSNLSVIDLISPSSHFFVTNSRLGEMQLDSLVPKSAGPATAVSTIMSSEVDLDFGVAPPFITLCLAVYKADGSIVPQHCY